MKLRLLLALIFILSVEVEAQNSFVKRIEQGNYYLADLDVEDSTALALFLTDWFTTYPNFYSCIFFEGSSAPSVFRIFMDPLAFKLPQQFVLSDSSYMMLQFFGNEYNGISFFFHDLKTGNYWMKGSDTLELSASFIQKENGDVFLGGVSVGEFDQWTSTFTLNTFLLNDAGVELNKRGFMFFYEDAPLVFVRVAKIVETTDGQVVILAEVESEDEKKGALLLSFDSELHLLSSLFFPFQVYSDLAFSLANDKLYLLGHYQGEVAGDSLDGVLLTALDANGSIHWSKVYYAEQFHYQTASLHAMESENQLVLSYSTEGFFPTILAKVDQNGIIQEQMGYPFYEPLIGSMSNGSLALASRKYVDSGGSGLEWGITVAKTDEDGFIDGCEQFPSCLLSKDVSISSEEVNVDTLPVVPLFDVDVEVEPWGLYLSDACSIPSVPSAEFSFPDTLCVGECAVSEGVSNEYAQAVSWHLSGPAGIDEVLQDSLMYLRCFDEPGDYVLTQTVWVLGCAYSYSREIIVLPDLAGQIAPEDQVICSDPPLSLSVSASRPLSWYLWSDGSQDSSLLIWDSGVYWVSASDGYCQLQDSLDLTFLQDLLTEGPPLSLPADTSVCELQLPYVLFPESPYTDVFDLPDFLIEDQTAFSLRESGLYEVEADVWGCVFRDTFVLSVNDCSAPVYLPTAFSPNGDGFNDVLFPQGKYFKGVSLSVYDRWGGLVFSTEEPPFAWTGLAKDGMKLTSGSYLVCFVFENLRAGTLEQKCSLVHLIR